MTLSTNASVKADIQYSVSESTEKTASDQGSLGFSADLTYGTGQTGIDATSYFSGSLPAGGQLLLDFQAFPKYLFGSSYNLNFNNIKGIAVENLESGIGTDISIQATGSNALTELFNGGSGNQLVKPNSAFQYSDIWTGMTVDSSNRYAYIVDNGGSGSRYAIIVVGVTG